MELHRIGFIRSDFPTKFGIPRQSGRVEGLQADILFDAKYRAAEAFRGLEAFSHIWILWGFSENEGAHWSPTVRPPRLGGNKRMGVFATRSPFRPNAIGLSSVRLLGMELDTPEGPVLHVGGADLMDGTPIYDIKPYLSYDCHPDALEGIYEETGKHSLSVLFPEELKARLPQEKLQALLDVLAEDPRPGYHDDSERIYGMPFSGWDVRFSVKENQLRVVEMVKLPRG